MESSEIKRTLLKGGLARIFSIVFRKSMGIVKVIIFARIFTPNDIGIIVLAASAAEFISWMAGVGMPEFAIKEKSQSSVNSAFSLSIIFSIAAFVLFLILSPFLAGFLSDQYILPYVLFSSYIIFTIPASFPQSILLKDLKFEKAALPAMINDLSSIVFSLSLYYFFRFGIWSIIAGQAAGFIISNYFLWRMTELKPRFILDISQVKRIISYTAPLSLKNFGSIITRRLEVVVISRYYSMVDMAYYNYANNLIDNFYQFLISIDGMLLPVFAKIEHNLEELKKWYDFSCKIWASVGVPVGLFFFYTPGKLSFCYSEQNGLPQLRY